MLFENKDIVSTGQDKDELMIEILQTEIFKSKSPPFKSATVFDEEYGEGTIVFKPIPPQISVNMRTAIT